jgi:glycosyltransferase involved in cell wall biosynthesis
VRSISVIHDINFEHNPQYLLGRARKYFLTYFKLFAKEANRIATVSQYSKKDIIETYGINPDKIDLVYNGIGNFFKPLNEEDQAQVRQTYTSGSPYFVFIGALNPRKNLEGMLAAYKIYRQEGGDRRFLVVGTKMYWPETLEKAYSKHPYKADIIFTGRLEREGLNQVLASAQALLFVSHFEGFGIPMIEAFQCHVPVITSTKTSLPEVADGAALLFEPNNHESIANAMFKVQQSDVRQSLVEKGIKRAAFFSWEQSADMMWGSIQKCLADEA